MSASSRDRSLTNGASLSATPNSKRRRFLFALGASGAGAAAAAAAPAVAAGVAPEAAAAAPASRGYQLSDHVRDYYASTRLPKA